MRQPQNQNLPRINHQLIMSRNESTVLWRTTSSEVSTSTCWSVRSKYWSRGMRNHTGSNEWLWYTADKQTDTQNLGDSALLKSLISMQMVTEKKENKSQFLQNQAKVMSCGVLFDMHGASAAMNIQPVPCRTRVNRTQPLSQTHCRSHHRSQQLMNGQRPPLAEAERE